MNKFKNGNNKLGKLVSNKKQLMKIKDQKYIENICKKCSRSILSV